MTPEEIFNRHSWEAIGAISPSKDFCIKAMQEYAKQIADKAYNACWTNTAEGWNGEIQPLCYMPDKHVDSYERQKEQFLNSIFN